MMAHGGTSAGSFIQTLRMVDVPPGGPSALSLVNRDGSRRGDQARARHRDLRLLDHP